MANKSQSEEYTSLWTAGNVVSSLGINTSRLPIKTLETMANELRAKLKKAKENGSPELAPFEKQTCNIQATDTVKL